MSVDIPSGRGFSAPLRTVVGRGASHPAVIACYLDFIRTRTPRLSLNRISFRVAWTPLCPKTTALVMRDLLRLRTGSVPVRWRLLESDSPWFVSDAAPYNLPWAVRARTLFVRVHTRSRRAV